MPKSDRSPVFTPLESSSILSLSSIMFFRMFGLFLVLPVFSILAQELDSATPLLIGLAFGGYGLTQAILQIPFGIWSDRIGRKPVIMAGLLLFIIGSLIAAFADNIYLMIVARLLQGAGAISSAVFALIADLTRPEVRTRANAGIGASIGIAFGGAFFIAPFLGSFAGFSGIFGLISLMATIGLFILWRFVPEPENPSRSSNTPTLDMIKSVLVLPSIRTIDFGAFVCSTGLSAVFFMIPIQLAAQGWISSELWKIYLPMLLSGGLIMVGSAIIAETKNCFREVMFVGVGFLIASVLCLNFFHEFQHKFLLIAGLFLFFMGFNVFEPLFPSLVTRLTNTTTKGAASGVYNFCQFMGHFAGAAIAGIFYSANIHFLLSFLLMINLSFLFLLYKDFQNPAPPQK